MPKIYYWRDALTGEILNLAYGLVDYIIIGHSEHGDMAADEKKISDAKYKQLSVMV